MIRDRDGQDGAKGERPGPGRLTFETHTIRYGTVKPPVGPPAYPEASVCPAPPGADVASPCERPNLLKAVAAFSPTA